MRVGIIGCGSIGRRHLDLLVKLGVDVGDIVAYDVNPEALQQAQQRHRVVTSESWEMFSRLRPNVVLVCSPAIEHAQHIHRVLDDGLGSRGLFVEKPFTIKAVDAIRLTADAHALSTTMVACNWRFHPGVRYLLDQMRPHQHGAIGHFWCHQDMDTWPGSGYADATYEGVHELDLALQFFPGEVRLLRAKVLPRTVVLVLGVTSETGIQTVHIDLNFETSRVSRGMILLHGGALGVHRWDTSGEILDMMYRNQMAHFMECAHDGTPTVNTFTSALKVSNIVESAVRLWA